MLFSEEIRFRICIDLGCPGRERNRTKGLCIRKERDGCIYVDAKDPKTPSVMMIFRDPVIQDSRKVSHVLDIRDPEHNRMVSSNLFDVFAEHIFSYFPDGLAMYLDNFIRCPAPVTLGKLRKDYWRYYQEYADRCMAALGMLVRRMPNLKCVIFADVKPLVWLGRRGILAYSKSEIDDYIEWEGEGIQNSTVFLGERLGVSGWDLPVFYVPHPKTIQRQYEEFYAPGKKHFDAFEDNLKMVLDHIQA
jgi:hypothetical protein